MKKIDKNIYLVVGYDIKFLRREGLGGYRFPCRLLP